MNSYESFTTRGNQRPPINIHEGDVISSFRCTNVLENKDLQIKAYYFRHLATDSQYVHIDWNDTDNVFGYSFLVSSEAILAIECASRLQVRTIQVYPTLLSIPSCVAVKSTLCMTHSSRWGTDLWARISTLPLVHGCAIGSWMQWREIHIRAILFPPRIRLTFSIWWTSIMTLFSTHCSEERTSSKSPGIAMTRHRAFRVLCMFYSIPSFCRYDEMKGYYSQPAVHQVLDLKTVLLPNTKYNTISGGDPLSIPSLDYDHFLSFYKNHYYPSYVSLSSAKGL